MPTATRLTLTPADHGRDIDPDDFDAADGEEGYHYEIIDGRVYVSPVPNMPQEYIAVWLHGKLFQYTLVRPDVVSFLSGKTRVFVPGRRRRTCPEPDISAFNDVPRGAAAPTLRWQDFSPFLVIEIPSDETPEKDLVRNVELYREVPSIREYWILDANLNPGAPDLRVYRRRGERWQKPIDVPFGGAYETPRLLPGFRLVVDPTQ
jgi:Uma2 family endonuclease